MCRQICWKITEVLCIAVLAGAEVHGVQTDIRLGTSHSSDSTKPVAEQMAAITSNSKIQKNAAEKKAATMSNSMSQKQAFRASKHDANKKEVVTDNFIDKLVDRALKEWPKHQTASNNTTLEQSVFAKLPYDIPSDLAYYYDYFTGSTPKPMPEPMQEGACNAKRMQIDAQWTLVSCGTEVIGELKREVEQGISNTSKYTERFNRMVKDQFYAGMLTGGPFGKNKVTGEGAHFLASAWSTSSKTSTTDEVECEAFGGTWCLWQWHMTFSRCSEVIDWDAPITECTRGKSPPAHPPHGIEAYEPGVSELLLASPDLTNTWSCMVVVFLSMAIASCLVANLRRSPINQMNMYKPLCEMS